MATTATSEKRGLLVPTVLLLIGGISFGSVLSANKFAVDAGFPVLAYSFWQAALGAAILLIGTAIFSRLPRLVFQNLRVFALVAVFGMVGPTLVLVMVAGKLPPAVVTIAVGLIPVATYLLSIIVRTDSLRAFSVAGVLLGFGGILLIVLPSGSLPDEGMALWVIFSLLVPVSAAINNVAGAKYSPTEISAIALSAGMMTLAAILMFIVMFALEGPFLPTDAGTVGLWSVLWAAGSQALTYTCFFEIVRRAGALFFAQINYVVVAAGLIWASALFGESLSYWVWAAVATLAVSLTLINLGTARALRARVGG